MTYPRAPATHADGQYGRSSPVAGRLRVLNKAKPVTSRRPHSHFHSPPAAASVLRPEPGLMVTSTPSRQSGEIAAAPHSPTKSSDGSGSAFPMIAADVPTAAVGANTCKNTSCITRSTSTASTIAGISTGITNRPHLPPFTRESPFVVDEEDDELICLCPPAVARVARSPVDTELHILPEDHRPVPEADFKPLSSPFSSSRSLSRSASSSSFGVGFGFGGAVSPTSTRRRGATASPFPYSSSPSRGSSTASPGPLQFRGTPNGKKNITKNYWAPASPPSLSRSYSARTPTPAPPISLKYKTELCESYATTGNCFYGPGCNFAHGASELRTVKVSDLQAAGVVDAENHRVRPCLTFVSTGSCPFGIRCKFLHDPRVASPADVRERYQTWLDHYDHPVQNVESDLVVDNLYNYFANGVHHNNPFGAALAPATSSFASESVRYAEEDGKSSAYYDVSRNYFYKEELWDEFYNAIATGTDLSTLTLPEEYEGRKEEEEEHTGRRRTAAVNSVAPSSPSRSNIGNSSVSTPTPAVRGLAVLDTSSPACVASASFGPAFCVSYRQGPKLSEKQWIKIALNMCFLPSTELYTYEPRVTVFGKKAMVVQSRAFAISEDGEVEAIASRKGLNKMATYESNVVNVFEIAFGPDTDPKAKISTALYFDLPHQCIQKLNAKRCGTSPLAMMTVDVYLGTATNQPFYLTRPYDDDASALTRGILEHRLEMIDLHKWEEDLKEVYVFSDSTKIEKIRAHSSSVEMVELGLRSRFECLLRHWGIVFWGRCAERFDSADVGATVLHVNGNFNPLTTYHRGTGEARSVRLWNSFVSVMRSGCFSGDDNPATDIKECDCPVHIKTSFADGQYGQNDQDDGKPSLYTSKERCWRDLLLSNDDEGEWELARRTLVFQKEQKKMSRPSSRASQAASMARPSSRASSRASNASYCGVNGIAPPDARLRPLPCSMTPFRLDTPVSFAAVTNVEEW